jgi:hypothetical protein
MWCKNHRELDIGFFFKKTFNGTEIQLLLRGVPLHSERKRAQKEVKGANKATTVISEKPATTCVFQTSY